jgi:ATP-dependent RNA helicase DeaD
MIEEEHAELLGPGLSEALAAKGFTDLTAVQLAVLNPEVAGRDLRISSQTGSGKTVAIGFVLRDTIPGKPGEKGPRAMVITPTRELAKQVEQELAWLFAPLRARVVSVTGGSSYRDEHRALSSNPSIVVGTPGRLLDHLNRGSINTESLGAIVLDEADRMLDLGFREDLEAILGHAPEEHRTHLVSATFPADVRALADRVQRNPVFVEGSRLGAANEDIRHVLHLVDSHQRLDAVINLLLSDPEAQTLVFARTRADVARIAADLSDAGFAVSALSGEMEQRARERALSAFKRADHRVLVATDVAARGIDVQDITRVIHVEPPTDADSYTHRSGRTGRAGRKGTSSVLATPSTFRRTVHLLGSAGVKFAMEPVPSAADIRERADAALIESLTAEDSDTPVDDRTASLAARLLESGDVTRVVARLLMRARQAGPAEPREVRRLEPPKRGQMTPREAMGGARSPRTERPPRADRSGGWVPFRVSWGESHGADARRLLAMLCRRGGISGGDVGAIRIGRTDSTIEVASEVAEAFASATSEPDPRNPRVRVERGSAARPVHAGSERPPRPQASRGFEARTRAPAGDDGRHAASRSRPREERAPAARYAAKSSSEREERAPAATRYAAKSSSERAARPPRPAARVPSAAEGRAPRAARPASRPVVHEVAAAPPRRAREAARIVSPKTTTASKFKKKRTPSK